MPSFLITMRLVLLEALRSRLPWIVVATILVAVGMAQFVSQVTLLESQRIQGTLLAWMLRVMGVFLLATFVIASLVRESDDKVTEFLLAQPASRSAFYFGKFAGYSLLAFALALILAGPLAWVSPGAGLAAWTFSLAMELVLIVALCLFCALSLGQVLPALCTAAAFYCLGRTMGTIKLIAEGIADTTPSILDMALSLLVNAITLLLPSLDRFTQSAWLDSPPGSAELFQLASNGALFTLLLVLAGLFDLHRRSY